jgi:hypothetical protein
MTTFGFPFTRVGSQVQSLHRPPSNRLKWLDDFLNCRVFRQLDQAPSSEHQQNTAYKSVENAWNLFRVCSAMPFPVLFRR